MRPHTIILKERIGTECRLTPADVAFLLEAHRRHLRLAPSGRPGSFRLTPTGHVGTILCPTCRLVIRPKIPVTSLFYLLDETDSPPFVEDEVTTETGSEALDFLAGRLACLLNERASTGLHRAYLERTASGPFLQGRLDVPAQLRNHHGRQDQLHCLYEDFTIDVPCNQVPKATADLVLRSGLLGAGVHAVLRQALAPFAEVQSVVLGPDSFLAAEPDQLTQAYRPLLDLCRLLADSLQPTATSGSFSCPAFLLDMERVFERYVSRGVVPYFARKPRYSVAVQSLIIANRPAANLPELRMRPDLTINRAGRAMVVIDTKWKKGTACPLVSEDLYQVVAYATALGASRAVLVYPGRRDRHWRFLLAKAPLHVEVRTLRVIGSRQGCAQSLRRLAQAMGPGRTACDRNP